MISKIKENAAKYAKYVGGAVAMIAPMSSYAYTMPSPDASTTAQFAQAGLNPQTIYDTFVNLIGTAVSFGLWLVQVGWPFLLALGFIYLMWRLAHKFTSFGR